MSEDEKLVKRVTLVGFGISVFLSLLVLIFHRPISSLFTLSGGILSVFFFILLKGITYKFIEKRSFIYILLYILRLALIGGTFYAIIILSKREILYFFMGFLSIILAIMMEGVVQFLKLKRGTG